MIQQTTLGNGIRVVLEQIPHVQSVSVGIWFRTGAVDETSRDAGISHLIEHMMFKGTKTRSPKQLAEDADRIGASMNAFTGKEATCYYIKSLSSSVDRACELLVDMLTESVFDPAELEKEKDVIYEEIKMVEDTPDDQISDLLDELVFQGHPYGNSVLGSRDALAAIDRERILGYIRDQYTTDSMVISVSGHFDEERVLGIFENGLRGFQSAKTGRIHDPATAPARHLVKVKDVEQAHFCMGVRSIPHDDPLHFPMQIMNSAFGGSMSSRLFQNIREQKGLAYSIYSASHHFVTAGVFEVFAGIGTDNLDRAIAAIHEEMQALRQEGLTADELAIAREQVKSGVVFSRENVNNRMFSNGKNLLLHGRIEEVEEILRRLDAVSLDDIRAAAAVAGDWDRYSSVLICGSDIDLAARMREVRG